MKKQLAKQIQRIEDQIDKIEESFGNYPPEEIQIKLNWLYTELNQLEQINIMKNINKIIITAKEWFDKINGKSYFAVKIELENETLFIPFSYGYGDSYYYDSIELLRKENYLPGKFSPWEFRFYCEENNIVLSSSIQRKYLSRGLREFINKLKQ